MNTKNVVLAAIIFGMASVALSIDEYYAWQ